MLKFKSKTTDEPKAPFKPRKSSDPMDLPETDDDKAERKNEKDERKRRDLRAMIKEEAKALVAEQLAKLKGVEVTHSDEDPRGSSSSVDKGHDRHSSKCHQASSPTLDQPVNHAANDTSQPAKEVAFGWRAVQPKRQSYRRIAERTFAARSRSGALQPVCEARATGDAVHRHDQQLVAPDHALCEVGLGRRAIAVGRGASQARSRMVAIPRRCLDILQRYARNVGGLFPDASTVDYAVRP
jgi:hypothetical protein